jgi:hypothetical protein
VGENFYRLGDAQQIRYTAAAALAGCSSRCP